MNITKSTLTPTDKGTQSLQNRTKSNKKARKVTRG